MKFLFKFLERVFVVVTALLFLQAPLFMQEYRQQLAGHVGELQLQVDLMQLAATQSGKNLKDYVKKFRQSLDQDFSNQGEIMDNMVTRFQDFSQALNEFDNATVLTRPFVFMWHFHYDIASTTFHAFNIGLPLTYEGGIYALLGIFVGYGIFVVLRGCINLVYRPRKTEVRRA